LRLSNFPRGSDTDQTTRPRLPFRSREWGHRGTKIWSIPVNITNSHWTGVMVVCGQNGEGSLYYYDLFGYPAKEGPRQREFRTNIMRQIGKALNILPNTAVESEYLPPFRWKYHDVLTVDEGCKRGFPQKDCHSCGVIWMMIVWFVVTRERAPTLQDLRELELDLDEKPLANFRIWVAYSILKDEIWFTPENTALLHQRSVLFGRPRAGAFTQKMRTTVVSRLPNRARRIDDS
jgi:hypothetical protein